MSLTNWRCWRGMRTFRSIYFELREVGSRGDAEKWVRAKARRREGVVLAAEPRSIPVNAVGGANGFERGLAARREPLASLRLCAKSFLPEPAPPPPSVVPLPVPGRNSPPSALRAATSPFVLCKNREDQNYPLHFHAVQMGRWQSPQAADGGALVFIRWRAGLLRHGKLGRSRDRSGACWRCGGGVVLHLGEWPDGTAPLTRHSL